MRLTQFRKVITMKNKRMKKNVSGYYVPVNVRNEMLDQMDKVNASSDFKKGVSCTLAYLSAYDERVGICSEGMPFDAFLANCADLIPQEGNPSIPEPIRKIIEQVAKDLDCDDATVKVYHVNRSEAK